MSLYLNTILCQKSYKGTPGIICYITFVPSL